MQAKEENAGARCKCVGCGAVLLIPPGPSMSVAAKVSAPIHAVEKSDPGDTIGYTAEDDSAARKKSLPPAPASIAPPPPPPSMATPSPYLTSPGTNPLAPPLTDALKTLPYLAERDSIPRLPLPPPPPTPFPSDQGDLPTVPMWPAEPEPEMPWYQVDPRQERRKQRRVRLLIFACAILFVAALVGGAWFAIARLTSPVITPEKKAPPGLPQLTMVPRDAPFFVTVRVADLWAAKALAKTRTEFDAKLNGLLEAQFGLKVEEVDRFTLVVGEVPLMREGRPGVPHFWMGVHTRTKLDATRVREKMLAGAVEKKIGDKTLFVVRDMGVYFASDKEVWLGLAPTLESILSGERKIAMTGPLKDSIDLAAQNKHHLVAAMHLPDVFKQQMERAPNFPEVARPFLDLTGGSIAFNADADKGGDLLCRLKFTKPESARDGAAFVRIGIAAAKDELRKIPPAGAEQTKIIDQTMRLLNQSKVEDVGSDAIITVSGAGESLGPFLEALIPMLDRDFRPPPFLP